MTFYEQNQHGEMWTPEREDLLIELCGEIDDEDTSLVERAEERADRFVDYKDKRISDAERAHEAVSRIADNIPLGQPILIGHHSERHARKDAERIENGLRETVKMWHTAKYWEDRAKGALRHAKYKELPGVRHRRIKGLEADLRRYQNSFAPDPKTKPQMWDGEEHVWITNGSRGGRWAKSSSLPAIEQQSRRWIEHLQNRIAYEKTMLGEAGGIAAAQFTIEVGGRVLVADEWVDRIPSYERLHEMGKAAAAGVQVVIAPQLFPTPPELADRMVALADIRLGQQILEPSAGTGRIIDAIRRNAHGYTITAVELNCNMAHRLRTVDCVDDTRQADFLECNGDLGTFDRIVMNPPFANADDIKHIMHALKMLKPGGRLVAICANGPRQNDKLRPLVEARGGIWEELPSDTFMSAGTSVRTVLLMVDA
jgi:phospholipid N-methyltransferase